MLRRLEIENFRGFNKHEMPLNTVTLIVGRNNAGKSTVVEALRLVALVVGRYKHLSYNAPPRWLEIPKRYYGVAPSLKNMEINFESAFHRYAEPPAMIAAHFGDNSSVMIYLAGEQKIHAVIRDQAGNVVKSREQAYRVSLPPVSIMPQVAPVQRQEVILSEDYVRSAMSSSISHLHFRNQLNIQFELFPKFQRVVESTWPGVRVLELVGRGGLPTKPLSLHVRNEGFVAEVAAMGHGLQMWLQTMWFLARIKDSHTVILDEPDVYMHADLQRRLMRFLKNRYPQIIITTHSIEIMAEVEPDQVLVVDKDRPKSIFANSLPAVQRLIENVGSVHNIHLAKLWHSRRFVLVEGKDLKILKHFQNTLFPNSADPFDSIPHMSIGGWGGWKYAVGSSMLLQNALGERITTYCILDSDYHSDQEIADRLKDSKTKNVELHIWSQKEIENYLLVESAIHRLINRQIARRTKGPTVGEVKAQIEKVANSMKEEVFDALSTELLTHDRSLGSGGANKAARKIIQEKMQEERGLLSIVSGKTVISGLSEWSQSEFGVSLNAITIAKELKSSEIHEEICKVVRAIEYGTSFP
jgi:energy-coupling factor transporter ATP-binding protein EcfA2